MPRNTVFVSGFSMGVRARDIAYEFEEFGPLVRCEIPPCRNGRPYAFVEFEDERDADEAIYQMDRRTLRNGDLIRCEVAKSAPFSRRERRERERARYRERERGRDFRGRNRDEERGGSRDAEWRGERGVGRDGDRDGERNGDRDGRSHSRDRTRSRSRSPLPVRDRSVSPRPDLDRRSRTPERRGSVPGADEPFRDPDDSNRSRDPRIREDPDDQSYSPVDYKESSEHVVAESSEAAEAGEPAHSD